MDDFTFLRSESDSDMPPLNRAELLKWLLDRKEEVCKDISELINDMTDKDYYFLRGVNAELTAIINTLQDDTMPFNQG